MFNKFKQISAGVIAFDSNVVQVLRDKDGNIKPIWQENKLCVWLLNHGPANKDTGMLIRGYLSPLWINRWYAFALKPFLGHWAKERHVRNLVTSAGKAGVASRLNGSGSEAVFASIGQGTGTTAAAAGDTTLQTEVKADGTGAAGVHAVAAATASRVTGSVTNDTAQWVGSVSETATIAITESGVFNATTNGTLLCRQTFTAVNVVTGDTLQFTWQVKAS